MSSRKSFIVPRFAGVLVGGGITTELVFSPSVVVRPAFWLSRAPLDGILLASLRVRADEQLAYPVKDGGDPITFGALLGMALNVSVVHPNERITIAVRNMNAGDVPVDLLFVERLPRTPGDPGWGWLGARS